MTIIAQAHDWVLQTLKMLSCIVVFLIFVIIVFDVTRVLLGLSSWAGTIGVVEYGLLWFCMLAAPWLARIKGHVYIDALTRLLDPFSQKLVARFAYLVAITGSAAFCYFSVLLLWEAYELEQIDERGIELMLWWLYAPMPVSFFLLMIEFLRYLFGVDDMYGDRSEVREGM